MYNLPFRIFAGKLLEKRRITEHGCWEWTGRRQNKKNSNYGQLFFAGKIHSVHRVAAIIWLDFVPSEGACVLHSCDNPPCFNPEHLYVGTLAQNSKDMMTRGRHHPPPPMLGEKNGKTRLTEKEVGEIKRTPIKYGVLTSLARKYGISVVSVWDIVRGRTWKHIAISFLLFFSIPLFFAPKAFAQVQMTEARGAIRQLLSENSTDANQVFVGAADIDSAWVGALREIQAVCGAIVMVNTKVKIDSSTNSYSVNAATARIRSVYLFFSPLSDRYDHFLKLVDNPGSIPLLKGQNGPEYCFLHGQTLIVEPLPTRTESLMVYEYRHVTIPSLDTMNTNLPAELLRAPIWIAAGFLKNQLYQHTTGELYYKRGMDMVLAWKNNFQTQGLGGSAVPVGAGTK